MINQLIRYELKKVMNKRFFFAIVALLVIINTVIFYKSQYEDHAILIEQQDEYRMFELSYSSLSNTEAEKQLLLLQDDLSSFQNASAAIQHAELKVNYIKTGLLTEKNITDFEQSKYYDNFELLARDHYFVGMLLSQYNHVVDYPLHMTEMNNRAEETLKASIFQNPDSYSFRNVQKTIEDFTHYDELELTATLDQGIVSISSHQFYDLLMVIIMLVICYYLFQYEKDTRLLLLLRSNVNGRATTIIAKLIAYIILLTAIFLMVYLSMVAISAQLYGIPNLSTLIQSIPELSNGHYVLTIGQYLIAFFVVKWLVYIGIGLFIAILFIRFQHMGQIAFILLVSGILELTFYSFIHPNSPWGIFKYLNVFYVIQTDQMLTHYHNINILGYPITSLELLMYAMLVLIVVIVCVSIKIYAKANAPIHLSWLSISWLPLKLTRRHHSHKLFFHECYKSIFTGKSIIILLLAILFCYLNIQQRAITENDKRHSYMDYLSQYQGTLTEEKIEQIEQEKARLEVIPSKLQQLLEQYEANEITRETYLAESHTLTVHYAKQEGFLTLYDEMIQASSSPKTLELINQYAGKYLYNHDFRIQLQASIYLVLLILCTSTIVTIDYRTNMTALLKSTSGGRRRLLLHKHYVAYLLATLIYVLIYGTTYYNVLTYYSYFNWQAPIQSLTMFSQFGLPLTIWQFSLLQMLLHALVSLVIIECVLYLSELLKKQGLVISATIILFVFPLMLYIIGWKTINIMSLNALMLWPLSAATIEYIWVYCLVACFIFAVLAVAMKQRFTLKGGGRLWS